MKNVHKLTSWLALACILACMLPAAAFAASPVLTAETKTVKAGDSVDIAVTAEHFSPLLGIQVTMHYDSAALEAEALVKGTGGQFSLTVDNIEKPGVVTFVAASSSEVQVDGTLFTVRFKTKSGVNGAYPIVFSNITASVPDFSDYAVSGADGKINITRTGAASSAGTPSGSAVATYDEIVGNVAAQPDGAQNPPAFTDLEGHWAEEAVMSLAQKGIVSGKGEGIFDPDGKVTRAEITKMIALAFQLDASQGSGGSYTDVVSSAWYFNYVSYAAAAGVVQGYEDGTFRPENDVTRQELCVMLVRAAGAEQLRASAQSDVSFRDAASIAQWADESVGLLASAGIVSGDQDGNFLPEDGATRAETAKMIAGLLAYLER